MKYLLTILFATSMEFSSPIDSALSPLNATLLSDQEKANDPGDFVSVEKQPSVVKSTAPKYPEAARKIGLEGMLFYKMIVDIDGNVSKISLFRSEYTADDKKVTAEKVQEIYKTIEELNKAGENALKEWKFSPALLNGKPTRVWVTIPIKFKLDKDKAPKK